VGGALLVLGGAVAVWYFRRRKNSKYQAAYMEPQELSGQYVMTGTGGAPVKHARYAIYERTRSLEE
jgi:hypothetical protein